MIKIWYDITWKWGIVVKTICLEKNQINEATTILNKGGILAFPTDTVYGIAVRYDHDEAIKRMKQVKGRDASKPFPFMVSKKEQITEIALLNQRDYQLIEAWLPGALTFLFEKSEKVSDELTNGLSTVAVRMPDDEFVLSLIDEMNIPLLVTSANLSGETAGTTHEEVLAQLDGKIEGIILGNSGSKQASTIIDASKEKLILIRQGEISLQNIEESLEEKE